MKKSFNEEQIREFIFHFFSEKFFSVTVFTTREVEKKTSSSK